MRVRQCMYLGVIISFCFASCRSHEQDGYSLVFWSSSNPEEISFTSKYIDQWNNGTADTKINFQPVPEGQSSEEVILAAVVGKTTPDIYANMWQGDVEDFARSKVLVPLDTLDGFLEFLYQRCDSQVVQEITSQDGHIYQIPWKVNPIMLMYNSKLFAEAGVATIPSTYSAFLEAGQKIKRDDLWMGSSEVNAIWWQRFFNFLPLYYAASGGAPLIQNGKAVFNNEHGVEVFAFLQQLYSRGYFPKEQMKGQSDPFLAGKIACTFTGPWTIEQNERFKPEGFTYAFHPVPVPDGMTGPVYTYGDPKNIVIFNTCHDPETAWKFLQTMLTVEADKEFLTISGQFPRRKNIHMNPLFQDYLNSNPSFMLFALQVQHLRGMDHEPYLKEVLDIISQEYEACVVYGKKSPTDAIADAAKAVDLLFIH